MKQVKISKMETLAGFFLLFGMGLIFIMIFAVASKQEIFESRYKVITIFNKVSGLQEGASVRLAGIKVGNVESLEFTPAGKVKVIMSIRKRYEKQIRSDSIASIGSVGLLGDKSIEITVGSRSAKKISPMGVIKSVEPVTLSDIIDKAAPYKVKIDSILTNLDIVIKDLSAKEGDLLRSICSAKEILSKVSEGKGTLSALINERELYSEASQLINSGNRVLSNIEDVTKDLKATIASWKKASKKLPEIANNIKSATKQIDMLTTNLEAASRDISSIVKDVSVVIKRVQRSSRELPSTMENAKEGISDFKTVFKAAKKNWLIRGYIKKPEKSKIIRLDSDETIR